MTMEGIPAELRIRPVLKLDNGKLSDCKWWGLKRQIIAVLCGTLTGDLFLPVRLFTRAKLHVVILTSNFHVTGTSLTHLKGSQMKTQ